MRRETRAADVIDRARAVLDRFGVSSLLAAFLYGSVREGRQREDSDVDIAILDDGDVRLSWDDQAALADELERAIEAPVDLRLLRDCPLSLQAHIISHGISFWKSADSAVNTYRDAVLRRHEEGRADRERKWEQVLRSFGQRDSGSSEQRLSS